MNNQTDVGIKFKNSVTGAKKVKEYAESLATIKSVLSGIDTGTMKQVESSSKSLVKETKDLNKTVKTAFNYTMVREFARALSRTFQEMSRLVTKSSEYVENINLFQVAFDGSYNSAEKFINKMSEMYGLDESWLTRTVGIFKQLSNAMNLSVEQGTKLSTLLTQMSIDISSLYNVDIERASSTLQSALAGQTKPIRGVTGADITQNTLQQTLNEIGINRYIADLSYAEKRLLIVISLTRQLEEATNDFGRTIESPANQMRILSEQWERFSRALGNLLLPIVAKILPYLNAIMMVLTEIINTIAVLLGFNIDKYNYFSGIADSALELEESLGGAVENAKKLKTGLRGFDKLNVITSPSSSSASSGGGAGGIDPEIMDAFNDAFDKYNEKLTNVQMNATKIRDAIMDWLGFIKVINPLTGKISWQYKGIKETLKNVLTTFMNLNPAVKVFIGYGLYKVISKIFDVFKKLIKLAIPKNVTKIADSFTKIYKKNKDLNVSLGKLIKKNKKLVTGLNGVKTAIKGVLTTMAGIGIISASVKSIKENGATAINVLGVIAGGITTVIGVAMTLIPILTKLGITFSSTWATATLGISLLITAITAIATALINTTDNVNEYKKSMDDLKESADASYKAGLATIENTQKLASELQTLVDANGNVKKSDEERVNYILTKVNEAYQTEYKLIDGKIVANGKEMTSNEELIQSIDRVMKKKRTEALLNAYQDVYNEALKQQNEILKEAEELSETKGELSAKQKKRLEELKKQYDTNSNTIKKYEELEMAYYSDSIDKMKELNKNFYDDSKTTYNDAFKKLRDYAKECKVSVEKDLATGKYKINITADTSQASKNINEFGNNLNKTGLGIKFNPIQYSWRGYAQGGLPPVGQLFVANEKGPELVGQIGGQSFVANQNQMMDLLDRKIGNANGMNNATFIIQVGSKEVARTVLTDLQDMAKSNGKPITIG